MCCGRNCRIGRSNNVSAGVRAYREVAGEGRGLSPRGIDGGVSRDGGDPVREGFCADVVRDRDLRGGDKFAGSERDFHGGEQVRRQQLPPTQVTRVHADGGEGRAARSGRQGRGDPSLQPFRPRKSTGQRLCERHVATHGLPRNDGGQAAADHHQIQARLQSHTAIARLGGR